MQSRCLFYFSKKQENNQCNILVQDFSYFFDESVYNFTKSLWKSFVKTFNFLSKIYDFSLFNFSFNKSIIKLND